MLIGHHLGLKGKVAEMVKEGNEKAIELNELVDELIRFLKTDHEYGLNGIYQFFPAQSEGNKVIFIILTTIKKFWKNLIFLVKQVALIYVLPICKTCIIR